MLVSLERRRRRCCSSSSSSLTSDHLCPSCFHPSLLYCSESFSLSLSSCSLGFFFPNSIPSPALAHMSPMPLSKEDLLREPRFASRNPSPKTGRRVSVCSNLRQRKERERKKHSSPSLSQATDETGATTVFAVVAKRLPLPMLVVAPPVQAYK